MLSRSTALLIGALVLSPLVVFAASTSDGEYRRCMQQAMNSRENGFFDMNMEYQRLWTDAMQERRSQLFTVWNIEDDRTRTNSIRDIERNYDTRVRDLQKWTRDRTNQIRNDFRNAERGCSDGLRWRSQNRKNVPVGQTCRGSGECYNPLGACTTEFGDCRPTCADPGAPVCVQVCTGTCVVR